MDKTIAALLSADSGESDWFKRALRDALRQEAHSVARDAKRVAALLAERAKTYADEDEEKKDNG